MVKTIFGTCGIRRKFTDEFSGPEWLRIGMAIGTYLGKRSTVLIGRDTRQTAELVQYAIMSGLLSCGCEVIMLHGSTESPYVTTPTVAYSTKHFKADAGIQVTASHNTPEYIGIKIWQPTGMGFTPAQEEAIDEIYTRQSFQLAKWSDVQKVKTITNANDIHIEAILQKIKAPLKFDEKLTVVADPGNGSACEIAPKLLQRLGVNVVTINSQPDGLFPGRDSEPNRENIKTLLKMVKNDDDLHVGIAFDGDADRVRFIDGNGNLIDADRIILLFAKRFVNTSKGSPSIVTPVNSSTILEDTLNPIGIDVYRTKIGDINVAIKIQEKKGTLGGEISGTYTWPEFHLGPDSFLSAAYMLQIMAESGPLEKLMEDVPQYHVIRINMEIKEEIFHDLNFSEVESIASSYFKENDIEILEVIDIDGLLIRFDQGFFLVRKSGTSPAIRLTCEHRDGTKASEILERIKNRVKELAR
ncbi:MAG: phosphopentomutase/phosphoglucosamine mutase [Candidatus Hodarchaeota archaeon]